MANYLDKWKTDFPETVNNQTRPKNGIDNSLAFNTDGFPQRITSDPVHAKLENDIAQQLFSNDQRLKDAIDSEVTKESNHEKASNAHANGIAGNAGSATKLATARTIQTNLASTSAASFNGTTNIAPGVTGTLPVGNGGTGQTNLDNVTVGTSKKVHTIVSSGTVGELVKATMGNDDSFRIAVGGGANNGWAELATADDGTEPIYVRQYADAKTDGFVTPTRTATLLDAGGNTQFPGTVTAPTFSGSLNGNANTASKLQTARTLSLTGKASGSASFDGSANASINVTSVDADSAGKWKAARTLSLSGRASGSVSMDGSANVTLNVTDVSLADKATADADGNNISNTYFKYTGKTGTDGDGSLWTRNGTKEYSAALPDALSGAYHYGQCISFATPDNRLDVYASHNASNGDGLYYRSGYGTDKKGWACILDSGNYNTFVPTKTGGGATGTWGINISGNAAKATTATTATTATNASHASNADSATTANILNDQGEKTAIKDGTKEPSGLKLYKVYNNGYPTKYGNLISIGGNGGGELLAGWSGENYGVEHLYYRNRRDNGALWSNWSTIAFTDDINAYAPTKTGGGASGTWGINISGNANTASTASSVAWSGVTGKPGTYPPSAHNHDSAYPSVTGTRASGTWGINISGNAASATNADKVDGYHASDLLRILGGNRTPVITDIFDRAGTIDMSTMSAADKAKHKANINKAPNMTQNIWNNSTGIHAYGGDTDISGFPISTLKLTQSWRNFDKLMILYTDDGGNWGRVRTFDVYEFNYCMTNMHSFNILFANGQSWHVYGLTKHGTDSDFKPSTETVLSCRSQNCGIIGIYGIKF